MLLRELANAGHVTDATLSARATPLLHALTAAHAYILMFVHTCRVGQVNVDVFFILKHTPHHPTVLNKIKLLDLCTVDRTLFILKLVTSAVV